MAGNMANDERSRVPAVEKSIEVKAPIDVAFRIFTSEMTTWWDLENYHIGKAKPVAVHVEPRVGGRWFERGDDGSECDWGKVLVWEPPMRVLLTWQILSTWQFDPNLRTEVDIRFEKLGDEATRVTLEHRLLENYGDAAARMRGIFDSSTGWGHIISAFAATVERTQR